MAAQNFTGTVEVVKRNDQGYWSIKTTDNAWFGCGKVKPDCEEGDEVAFDYSQNGKYSNADIATLEVISSGNAVVKKAKPSWSGKKNASSEGGSKDGYWEKKEERDVKTQKEIRFQAARNAAIEVIGAALKNNILVIPQGKKEGDQFKVLLTYVDKVTERFVTAVEAVNAPAVETKPKMAAKPVKVAVEEPEQVEEEFNDDISFV